LQNLSAATKTPFLIQKHPLPLNLHLHLQSSLQVARDFIVKVFLVLMAPEALCLPSTAPRPLSTADPCIQTWALGLGASDKGDMEVEPPLLTCRTTGTDLRITEGLADRTWEALVQAVGCRLCTWAALVQDSMEPRWA
jgi:hypothetical protein